jgi:hypothetical protein
MATEIVSVLFASWRRWSESDRDSRHAWRRVYYQLADGVVQLLDANDAFIARAADRIAARQRAEMRTY